MVRCNRRSRVGLVAAEENPEIDYLNFERSRYSEAHVAVRAHLDKPSLFSDSKITHALSEKLTPMSAW
jgi:hypothetical protein